MAKKIFPADLNLKEKLSYMAPAMMCMLFERYKLIKDNIPGVPNEVMLSSQRYRQENDVYTNYAHERVMKISDPEKAKGSYILTSILCADFELWCKKAYTAGVVNKGDSFLRTKLISILGEIQDKDKATELYGYRNGRWFGYKLRAIDGDEDEEDLKHKVVEDEEDVTSTKSFKGNSVKTIPKPVTKTVVKPLVKPAALKPARRGSKKSKKEEDTSDAFGSEVDLE